MRLYLLLAGAFAVRTVLVIQGGQYYWPDERLYRVSQAAAECLVQGDAACAMRTVVRPEHTLFGAIGVAPALVEQYLGANSRIPALFFASFSVISIWIVAQIARRLGADETEVLVTAMLLVCSTSWTYYSRHLLPYDVSIAFALLGLLLAVQNPAHRVSLWACGASCAAAFLSYSGSWALVAFTLSTPVFLQSQTVLQRVLTATKVVGGFFIPVLALFIGSALAGRSLLADYLAFARTVTQGSFAEGWSLPFAYLWHAEHGIAVLWFACLVLAAMSVRSSPLRSKLAVAGVLCVYGLLVLLSVVAGVFVVYGRTARQLVPLLCLVTAEQLRRASNLGWLRRRVLLPLILLQALLNLNVPLTQVFPTASGKKHAPEPHPRTRCSYTRTTFTRSRNL